MTWLLLTINLTALCCRAEVILSVPLNCNGMLAVQQGQVSQGWTLFLGDQRSRRCYLFKFCLFLCLFCGLSVGWKVFPVNHRSVLLCQLRTTQALKISSTQCCCLLPGWQTFLSIIGLFQQNALCLQYVDLVWWLQRVLSVFFFQVCESSHSYKLWETQHNQNILDPSIWSSPISGELK